MLWLSASYADPCRSNGAGLADSIGDVITVLDDLKLHQEQQIAALLHSSPSDNESSAPSSAAVSRQNSVEQPQIEGSVTLPAGGAPSSSAAAAVPVSAAAPAIVIPSRMDRLDIPRLELIKARRQARAAAREARRTAAAAAAASGAAAAPATPASAALSDTDSEEEEQSPSASGSGRRSGKAATDISDSEDELDARSKPASSPSSAGSAAGAGAGAAPVPSPKAGAGAGGKQQPLSGSKTLRPFNEDESDVEMMQVNAIVLSSFVLGSFLKLLCLSVCSRWLRCRRASLTSWSCCGRWASPTTTSAACCCR